MVQVLNGDPIEYSHKILPDVPIGMQNNLSQQSIRFLPVYEFFLIV